VTCEEGMNMAQGKLQEWAIKIVEELVDAEAKVMSAKETGFHLNKEEQTWEFIQTFSVGEFVKVAEEKGPTLLRIMMVAGIPYESRAQALQCLYVHNEPMAANQESESVQTAPTGSGSNKQNCLIVSYMHDYFSIKLTICIIKIMLTTYILLLDAHNRRFNLFQWIFGVWMFSHTVPYGMYGILSWLGILSTYTSVLNMLRSLSDSTQKTIHTKANSCPFLLIYSMTISTGWLKRRTLT